MGGWFVSEILIAAILIAMFEWKRLLIQPGKDRIVFFALLAVGAALSWLNLPETVGPTTWVAYLYRPLVPLTEP